MIRCTTRLLLFVMPLLIATSVGATHLIHLDTELDCESWTVGGVVHPSSALPVGTTMTYTVTADKAGDVLYFKTGTANMEIESYGWPFVIEGDWNDLVFDGMINLSIHLFIDDPVYDDLDEWLNLQIECEDPLETAGPSWQQVKSFYR